MSSSNPPISTSATPDSTVPILLPPPPLPSPATQKVRVIQILNLVRNYLGPTAPRGEPVGATLSGLRQRLETPATRLSYDTSPDTLAWDVREAIRTEFFKIRYPSPPPPPLLSLVANTEVILNGINATSPRPFFFPGARVAVPTEAGPRRAATTLQLRYKSLAGNTLTEALLHLDGPDGGGFQWVTTPALTLLPVYPVARPSVPTPTPVQTPTPPTLAIPSTNPAAIAIYKPRPARKRVRAPRKAVPAVRAQQPPVLVQPAPNATSNQTQRPSPVQIVTQNVRPVRVDPPPQKVQLPDVLLHADLPPREKWQLVDDEQEKRYLSMTSGALRRALDVPNETTEMAIQKIASVKTVQRIVARRKIVPGDADAETEGSLEYFVKWAGFSMKCGSWEKREALIEDVPGLVKEFDARHPEEAVVVRVRVKEIPEQKDVKEDPNQPVITVKMETEEGMKEENELQTQLVDKLEQTQVHQQENEGQKAQEKAQKYYLDDLTGVRIPSWLDTPIAELNVQGLLIQFRRPDEATIHLDGLAAQRELKKRQTRFKQENPKLGERLYGLSKAEAKSVLDATARAHREQSQYPILFPKLVGRVSPADHGVPFTKEDALRAPACWEGYLSHIGMRCVKYDRDLPPYMPTLEDATVNKLSRAREEMMLARAVEHRERAREVKRQSFRYIQAGTFPPRALFRDGVRKPVYEGKGKLGTLAGQISNKRIRAAAIVMDDYGFGRAALLRTRDTDFEAALKVANKAAKVEKGGWFDPTWACWRGPVNNKTVPANVANSPAANTNNKEQGSSKPTTETTATANVVPAATANAAPVATANAAPVATANAAPVATASAEQVSSAPIEASTKAAE